jgi:hypothetical protein
MSDSPLTGEHSNSKLAAVFDDAATARAAAAAITAATDLQAAQVKVITPDEPDPGIKLEPEGAGIRRTLVVAHVRLGIGGLIAGLVAFAGLMWAGIPFIVQSPWAAGLAMAFVGALGGLMLGGLVALRPDHDPYIHATRDAMAERRSTVVVHALSTEQADRAAELLAARGGEVTRTL